MNVIESAIQDAKDLIVAARRQYGQGKLSRESFKEIIRDAKEALRDYKRVMEGKENQC